MSLWYCTAQVEDVQLFLVSGLLASSRIYCTVLDVKSIIWDGSQKQVSGSNP